MKDLIEADGRSRVVIPGHPNQRFVVQENADGSVLLEPARVITDAQLEYDSNPELRELLARGRVTVGDPPPLSDVVVRWSPATRRSRTNSSTN